MEVDMKREMRYIKSILTPEEFSEYQKELERPLKIRVVGEYDRNNIKSLERIKREKVTRFLAKYADKQFHVDQTFYDYAMARLFETFRWSKEYPMAGVFKSEDGRMVMRRFVDSDRLIESGCARPSQGLSFVVCERKTDKMSGIFSFKPLVEWNLKKLAALENEAGAAGEYLIAFHTHPGRFYPSEGDLQLPYVGGVVGFENPNEELNKLAMESFLSHSGPFEKNPRWKEARRAPEELIREIKASDYPSYRKKIEIDRVKRYYSNGRLSYSLQPYEVDSSLWSRLCSECHPAIALFVSSAGQKPRRIPLYLNGKLL